MSEKPGECSFLRGGYCTTHEVKGTKFWIKNKEWKKKKDGTFGYSYTRRVGYTCIEKTQNTAPGNIEKVESLPKHTDGVVCTQKSNGIPSIFKHSDLEEVSHAGFESESTLPGIKEG